MQPSGHVELASPTCYPVKWKVRKVSAIRDFPKSFIPAQMHIANSSAERSINSPDREVGVEKVVLKPDGLKNEEVKARVESNLVEHVRLGTELTLGSDDAADGYTENRPLRIGIYPPPKRRNVPVVRDFPMALKRFSEQVNQSGHDIEDDIQSMESLMNDQDDGYESEESLMNTTVDDGLEALVTYDQDETVKQDGTGLKCISTLNIPRRRVSAVRCFPPGCGRNAVRLSEEELKKAIAESKNHCLSCSCSKLEVPFVDEESEKEGDDDFIVEEEEEIVDEDKEEEEGNEEMVENQAEWDEVVVEEEKEMVDEEEEVMVEDNFGITDDRGETNEAKGEGPREIVLALRAPRCSSTENAREKSTAKRKSFGTEEEEMVDKEEREMEEEEEEAVMTDEKEAMTKAKLQGERMVVIALRASRRQSTQNANAKQGGPRMVVQGLMASSQCIWRNNARKKVRK